MQTEESGNRHPLQGTETYVIIKTQNGIMKRIFWSISLWLIVICTALSVTICRDTDTNKTSSRLIPLDKKATGHFFLFKATPEQVIEKLGEPSYKYYGTGKIIALDSAKPQSLLALRYIYEDSSEFTLYFCYLKDDSCYVLIGVRNYNYQDAGFTFHTKSDNGSYKFIPMNITIRFWDGIVACLMHVKNQKGKWSWYGISVNPVDAWIIEIDLTNALLGERIRFPYNDILDGRYKLP